MSGVMQYLQSLLVLLLALVLVGCPARQTQVIQDRDALITGTQDGDFDGTLKKAEEAWAQRADQAKLEEALKLWEQAVQIRTPDLSDAERIDKLFAIYVHLARGYYFLADTHIRLGEGDEDLIEEEMKTTYELAVAAAEKAINVYSDEFRKKILYGASFGEAAQVVDEDGMIALYWYSVAIGKWAILEGFDEILMRKDDIFMIMSRIESLTPDLFHGAVGRYFGVYYTKLPFPGGDLPRSKAYFDRSLEQAPDYLATHVLYADNYAVKAQDRELYRSLLQQVLDAPAGAISELEPENLMEKEKARRLLEAESDRFGTE